MADFSSSLAIAISPLVTLSRWLNRKKISILYLHGISTQQSVLWSPLRHSTPLPVLQKNLALLARYYTFISLSQAIDILKGKAKEIDNAMVITLDDGYRSQLSLALPEFKRYNIVPTLYVSTAHTTANKPFWFDRLDYALQYLNDEEFTVNLGSERFTFDTRSRKALTEHYRKFRRAVKEHFEDDDKMRNYFNDIAGQIEAKTGHALSDIIDDDQHACLASWQQLNKHAQNDEIEVGNHTVHHARLANLNAELARAEINDAKLELAFQIAKPSTSFCYPDNSYTQETLDIVKAHGYDCALTTNPGLNGLHCDLMALKRFHFPHQLQPAKALFSVSMLRSWLDKVKE